MKFHVPEQLETPFFVFDTQTSTSASQQFQMLTRRPIYNTHRNAMIESRQCAIVMDSERQQVRIGNLVVAQHARPVEHFFIAQAEAARPKFMVNVGAG